MQPGQILRLGAVCVGAALLTGFLGGSRVRAQAAVKPAVATSPLGHYLLSPNPEMSWKELSRTTLAGGATLVELQLTSQRWHGILWQHHLLVVQPTNSSRAARSHTGMLYITGNYDRGSTARMLSILVQTLHAPAAILYDVPNQPLFAHLSEDALIAYTFIQYLQTGDETWPALFPMTRSAVTAMTALQQFSEKEPYGRLDHFIVAGASKRGWTTFFTGAVDPRVTGIAPMVYNNLNLPAQMPHQLAMWGKYSEQIGDYEHSGVLGAQATEAGKKLAGMVDPYSFRQELTMPKLLIHGTNDRYWALDAARFYYDELPGEKRVLYVPNAPHSLENDLERVERSTAALFAAVTDGKTLPNVSTTMSRAGKSVRVRAAVTAPASEVLLWSASTATGDFRESQWSSTSMKRVGDGYEGTIQPPATGHVAYFAEGRFGKGDDWFTLSSPVSIIPEIPAAP